MTSRDFVYWLQGFFEIADADGPLTAKQADLIRRHLSLVFAHEIDPKAGDGKTQAAFDHIHHGVYVGDFVARC